MVWIPLVVWINLKQLHQYVSWTWSSKFLSEFEVYESFLGSYLSSAVTVFSDHLLLQLLLLYSEHGFQMSPFCWILFSVPRLFPPPLLQYLTIKLERGVGLITKWSKIPGPVNINCFQILPCLYEICFFISTLKTNLGYWMSGLEFLLKKNIQRLLKCVQVLKSFL